MGILDSTLTISVTANSTSGGQGVDFSGFAGATATLVNDQAGVTLQYALDGVTWVTLGIGASVSLGVAVPSALRLRKTTADNFPVPLTVDMDFADQSLSPAQVAAIQNSVAVNTYTWATLPAPTAFIGTAYISDVGISGSLWRSDGAAWGLVNGSVVLGRGHVDISVSAASVAEEDLVSLVVPAGLIGANGRLEVTTFWFVTNSANNKTMRVKLGGTAFFANVQTAIAIFLPPPTRIWNRNSQSSQIAFAAANGNTTVATGTAATTAAIDTSIAQTLAISGQKASGAETLTLSAYAVELFRP